MFLILFATLCVLTIYKFVRSLTYWSRKGIYQESFLAQCKSLLLTILHAQPVPGEHQNLDEEYQQQRYIGVYHVVFPALLLRDPDLIKQITIKDFDYFVDRREIVKCGFEPFWDDTVIARKGETWKRTRSTLSPSFTSYKLRAMFGLINDCAQQLGDHLERITNTRTTDIDLKDVFVRFSIDVTASIAFGISCDSLKDRDNKFFINGEDAAHFGGKQFVFILAFPRLAKALGVKLFRNNTEKFFIDFVKKNIKQREEENIVRPDMIHLMMEARKGKLVYEEDEDQNGFTFDHDLRNNNRQEKFGQLKMTDKEIAAQGFALFLAGFDTLATTLCFLSYELSMHPEYQKKIHREIDEIHARCQGKLAYDDVIDMKYIEMVVLETLRKWSPVAEPSRTCVKPYTIQPKNPWEQPVEIKAGDIVVFRIGEIHRDPSIFPDPGHFDPERFNEQNRKNIKPYSFMPFGIGPRTCLGSRVALLQLKVAVFHLFLKYETMPMEKTKIPFKNGRNMITLCMSDEFWLRVKPR